MPVWTLSALLCTFGVSYMTRELPCHYLLRYTSGSKCKQQHLSEMTPRHGCQSPYRGEWDNYFWRVTTGKSHREVVSHSTEKSGGRVWRECIIHSAVFAKCVLYFFYESYLARLFLVLVPLFTISDILGKKSVFYYLIFDSQKYEEVGRSRHGFASHAVLLSTKLSD